MLIHPPRDVLMVILAGGISAICLITNALNRNINGRTQPFPCCFMYWFTGVLMIPAAAMYWFAVCIWILLKFRETGLLILLVLFLTSRVIWFINLVNEIEEEITQNQK